MAALATIWFIIFPKVKPAVDLDDPKVLAKYMKLQKDLGIDATEAGAVNVDERILAAANQPKPPNFIERAQAKLTRLDQGIENAPHKMIDTVKPTLV